MNAKITRQTLLQIARYAVTREDTLYPSSWICSENGRAIIYQIDRNFIERYCRTRNLVLRANSGNKARSSQFITIVEKKIAYHLGQIAQGFWSGLLDEDNVENLDETHLLYDMDYRSCVSLRGAKSVNYLDVVSGCEGMTVTLRVTGGQYSRLVAPFFIFKNRNENYPIVGTPDDVLGTSYRPQRNG